MQEREGEWTSIAYSVLYRKQITKYMTIPRKFGGDRMECLLGADNLVIFQAMAKLSTSLLSLLSVLPEALTGTAKKKKRNRLLTISPLVSLPGLVTNMD